MDTTPETHTAESLLRALEARGVREIRRVQFKGNRVRLLSVSRDRRTLHLHDCFRAADAGALDAIAAFLTGDRRSARFHRAVTVLRTFAGTRLAPAAARGSRPPRPGRCCGTPAQQRFLRELYRELNRSCFANRLPTALPVRFSARMRRRLGHVRYHRRPAGGYSVIELALNVDLLLEGSEAQLLDTMLHEMAHVEAWLVHGHRGHGTVWKRIALRAGCEPRACTRAEVPRRGRGGAPPTRVPVLPLPGGRL